MRLLVKKKPPLLTHRVNDIYAMTFAYYNAFDTGIVIDLLRRPLHLGFGNPAQTFGLLLRNLGVSY